MATTIQHGDAQNKLGNPSGVPNYSNFKYTKHRYTTERFGIIDVCGVYNGIEADQVDWRPAHELTTYTLKAPLMSPVFKEKDYIVVARQALLPRNWNKIHLQPAKGEDIDASTIGTSVKAADWTKLLNKPNAYFLNAANAGEAETLQEIVSGYNVLFQGIILGEYLFSYGSLCTKMGARFVSLYKNDENKCYDIAMDTAIGILKAEGNITLIKATMDGNDMYVNVNLGTGNDEQNGKNIGLREFLDIYRENPGKVEIKGLSVKTSGTLVTSEDADDLAKIGTILTGMAEIMEYKTYPIGYEKPVDTARMWAYQLGVMEYYTNSFVDDIYSAELYRQYVDHLYRTTLDLDSGYANEYFEWNGISYEYDYLSAYRFAKMVEYLTPDYEDPPATNEYALEYMAACFSWRRSLKYLDYFVGSKTRPLATGDVTINPGIGGAINVIDVTRRGQAYKFYNAINRIGRKAEDVALEVMGVKQQHDWHNPLWLGSTRTGVNAAVTDNTGEAQMTDANAQTSRLYGVDGKYKFSFNLDRDSIVIGYTFYDVERSYTRGVHRSFMHVDRFDMFNPFLQYTGDQEIYAEEYDAAQNGIFGYTPAYEEFKQEYNTADGGFPIALPGYTFLDEIKTNNRGAIANPSHIGSDFIRSKPVEFDRFYTSLTGYSLGTYFHFIIDYYNDGNAKRRMAFNPGVAL